MTVPDSTARWYSVDAIGMATLCRDQQDAIQTAADNSIQWPNLAPHRAMQLCDAGALHAMSAALEMAIAFKEGGRAMARAALAGVSAGGWVAVTACPDGDVWLALSCGHVVMGWKQGDLLDWEAMCDHDCCHDAHAVKAQPVATPTHPDLIS